MCIRDSSVRVPQPPDQSSNAGYREAAANRGRLFFGYFILAKQKKVTSCRATPGGFDFSLYTTQSARRFAATLRYLRANVSQESGCARHGGWNPPYKITSRSSPV